MPLLLADLDNTLIDRAGAFRRWAREFVAARGGGAADEQWLAAAGQPLAGAWMIGDSAEADMAGARNAGLPGVWLHRGRAWPLAGGQPEHTVGSFPEAIGIVLATG